MESGNAIDVDRPEGVELENALRREGLVVGDLDVNGVAEGSVSLYLEKSSNSLQVNTYVRKHANGQSQLSPKAGGWQLSMQARPGDRVDYLIRAKNNSVDTMWDMVIGDNLPDYVSYIPGSTVIYSMSQPDGLVTRSENLTKGGLISAHTSRRAWLMFSLRCKLMKMQSLPNLAITSSATLG
ncbi:DUF11 domain-containing protein [Rhodococcus hoagii]|nr:DUF11 domain-containing protein [Prescottella equi]